MTRKLVFTSLAFFVSTLVAHDVLAQCPSGKTAVTMLNPAGKVIELCVPDAAVDHIGGNGVVVIPASCPCWTTTTIDEHARQLSVPSCSPNGTQLTVLGSHFEFAAAVGEDKLNPGEYACHVFDNEFGTSTEAENLTLQEAEACYVILVHSDMWALNCAPVAE